MSRRRIHRRGVLPSVVFLMLLGGCNPSAPAADPSPSATGLAATVQAPIGLAGADDVLWAVSSQDRAVVRIDPSTGASGTSIEVGRTPLRAALDGELLWVSVFGDGHVVAVDVAAGQVVRDTELGGGPEGIGFGFDSVWVVRQDAQMLTRLDRDGATLADVPVGTQPRLLGFGRDAVWVSDFGSGTVVRIDPASLRTQTSAMLCQGPQGLAVDNGVVWVACTTSDEVVAMDEQTLAVRGRVAVSGEPDGLLVHDGKLMVATTEGPALVAVSLDPDAPSVLGRTVLAEDVALHDRANVDLAVAGGRLWVSALRSNKVYASS